MVWFIPLLKLIGIGAAKKGAVATSATTIGAGAFATVKGATVIGTAKTLVVSSFLVWGGTELVDKIIAESGYSKGQYSNVEEEMKSAYDKKEEYFFRLCLNNDNVLEIVNENIKFCPYDGSSPQIGKGVKFSNTG